MRILEVALEQSIYVMDANGSGLHRVTGDVNPEAGTGIAWQP